MRELLLVALLACSGTSAGYAQEDRDSSAASKLVAIEHLWSQTYLNRDPKALERILDDAFLSVDSDGVFQTKSDLLVEVTRSTTMQVLTESITVHLHGDTAIVTGIFLIKGLDRGKPFAQRERFLDTWFYKNGQWVSIAGLVTRIGQ
jgi:ketosteroid isomerase-like protein